MFEIYGVPPFQTQEQKLTTRNRKEEAVRFAENLASHGYKNLRVVGTEEPAAPVTPAEQPAPKKDLP